jgi:hypothetical protein
MVPCVHDTGTVADLARSYNELPYESGIHRSVHPIRLSSAGRIRGVDTAPIDGCRILEFGCAQATDLVMIRAIVAWFGAGSLGSPESRAEWAWTLATFGCSAAGVTDRDRLLADAAAIVADVELIGVTDSGPTTVLDVLRPLAAAR